MQSLRGFSIKNENTVQLGSYQILAGDNEDGTYSQERQYSVLKRLFDRVLDNEISKETFEKGIDHLSLTPEQIASRILGRLDAASFKSTAPFPSFVESELSQFLFLVTSFGVDVNLQNTNIENSTRNAMFHYMVMYCSAQDIRSFYGAYKPNIDLKNYKGRAILNELILRSKRNNDEFHELFIELIGENSTLSLLETKDIYGNTIFHHYIARFPTPSPQVFYYLLEQPNLLDVKNNLGDSVFSMFLRSYRYSSVEENDKAFDILISFLRAGANPTDKVRFHDARQSYNKTLLEDETLNLGLLYLSKQRASYEKLREILLILSEKGWLSSVKEIQLSYSPEGEYLVSLTADEESRFKASSQAFSQWFEKILSQNPKIIKIKNGEDASNDCIYRQNFKKNTEYSEISNYKENIISYLKESNFAAVITEFNKIRKINQKEAIESIATILSYIESFPGLSIPAPQEFIGKLIQYKDEDTFKSYETYTKALIVRFMINYLDPGEAAEFIFKSIDKSEERDNQLCMLAEKEKASSSSLTTTSSVERKAISFSERLFSKSSEPAPKPIKAQYFQLIIEFGLMPKSEGIEKFNALKKDNPLTFKALQSHNRVMLDEPQLNPSSSNKLMNG